MENEPVDPTYDEPIYATPHDPDHPPRIEPGWWQLIGGAWRWMTDPTE